MSIFLSSNDYFFTKDSKEEKFKIYNKTYSMWIRQQDSNRMLNIVSMIEEEVLNNMKKYPSLSNNMEYIYLISCVEIINRIQSLNSDYEQTIANMKTEILNIKQSSVNELSNSSSLFNENYNVNSNKVKQDFKQILKYILKKIKD